MKYEKCEAFLRARITELRISKNISEHKMSLELGKSGSYIRGITNGTALPSVRELFNIIEYFDLSPQEFFAPFNDKQTAHSLLCERLRALNEEDLEKVSIIVGWIESQK